MRYKIVMGILIFTLCGYSFCLGSNSNVYFIAEKELPRKVAIVGPVAMQDKKIELAALGMVLNVVKNYLSGKGYIIRNLKVDVPISPKIKDSDIKKVFEKQSDIDGVFLIKVYELSSFNIAFAQYYKMDGEIILYKRDKKLGSWREKATRKKLSIATDPLGAIATVVSTAVSSEGNVNIKNVIFEWAFKVSSLIPSFSEAIKKPKILRVVTNVTETPFKKGDKIMVGMEGTPGGKATFDIEPLIKGVPMAEVQNGIYKGMYLVKEGDKLENGIIYLHLKNQRGEQRDWIETSPLVSIDGIPPQMVTDFTYRLSKDSITLSWKTEDSDVIKFEIYRSNKPLSGYQKVAEVKEFFWTDRSVTPGGIYFYRIVSVDAVGNRSKAAQLGPVSIPTLTRRVLPDVIISNVSSGKYEINGTVKIPFGSDVTIGPNVDILFKDNSTLLVEGNLKLEDSFISGEDSNGTKDIKVLHTGSITSKDVKINKIKVDVEGKLNANHTIFLNGKNGLLVNTFEDIYISESTMRNFEKAIIINDGKVNISKTDFENNRLSIWVKRGEINLEKCNFLNNIIAIESYIPLVLKGNYLGGARPSEFKLKGDIKVESFLDNPYPKGKEIFMKDLIKQAKAKEKEAIHFLNKGNYGKAVEIFKEIIPIYHSATTYIYYIYALSMISDESIEDVIEEAIKNYPYEIRIYQLGIRYFLQVNEKKKAKKLLDKGLKLNPNNPTLVSMKVFFEN